MAVACPNMSIVVIVPYHNESKSIEKTLDSIDSQTMKPDSVILVDSGSTDKTPQIINEWINKNNTKLFKNIHSGDMSPSSSINLGIKSSEEKIIAYVDCGLDIPSNWLMSSIAQMKKDNSDMVSIRIFTDGKNIIDKSFIAQTYGFKNNQICLPGSLIKRNVFDLIGLFLNKVRASYDTDFIKKFHLHNLKRSINDKVVLKYFGINYTNSLSNGAKKVYSYSLDAWNATGDMKPIIYIVFTIVSLITFFLQPKIFFILMVSYLISRTILIPIYKSKKSSKLKVVAIDYGIKKNILNCLLDLNLEVILVPAKTSVEKILSYSPNGIFLSNGPGDPKATGKYAIPVIKKLIKSRIPLFGICLEVKF